MTRAVDQRITIFTAVCAIVGTLVVIQLWLLASSVESVLRGERDVPAYAAASSAVLACINAALLFIALRFDRRTNAAR